MSYTLFTNQGPLQAYSYHKSIKQLNNIIIS
jgi:hypothetical protein